jgi:light-regulated signal transduction histidine kinase (bacteriophytochrome)
MPAPTQKAPGSLDLSACDREPIHVPGSIQPYGALFLVGGSELIVEQAAVAPHLPLPPDTIGRALAELLPQAAESALSRLCEPLPASSPLHLGTVDLAGTSFHMLAHASGTGTIVELEEMEANEPTSFEQVYPVLRELLGELGQLASIDALSNAAAARVRELTGFDRTLVYRFDAEWNGAVLAESNNGVLPSYLGLRWPASDIPAQARELYRLNRLRLIPDASYRPVPITPERHPRTGEPLDLSFAALRSVSPVHLEYMRNMGTGASMSISLMQDDRLWGLISCHSSAPRRVPFHVRMACDFVGQMLSLQLTAREQARIAQERIALRSVTSRLLAQMAAEENFIDGLVRDPSALLEVARATGAAVLTEQRCDLVGITPNEDDVGRIAAWLTEHGAPDLFSTDQLPLDMPGAEQLQDVASGLLAVSVSQLYPSYVLWFRPEVVRTVEWGGDPQKRAEPDGDRLHPRRSFEAWKQVVRCRSLPWAEAELDAVGELRTAIVDVVLRSAEELASVANELTRSNKELEAFSYSVSHDLRAPFRHIVGYAQLLKQFEGEKLSEKGNRFVETIIESALSAGVLVDDLLSYSQMGRATLNPRRVDMNSLVAEELRRLAPELKDRRIEWRVDDLPPAFGDPLMLRLVMQNLLENAVKFTRERDPAVIEVGADRGAGETKYFVRDNGTGFDMAYAGKLFGVFQRLHRVEEFEGTGIGLANVKRVLERHHGRVWAEGEVGKGATFWFALPQGM